VTRSGGAEVVQRALEPVARLALRGLAQQPRSLAQELGPVRLRARGQQRGHGPQPRRRGAAQRRGAELEIELDAGAREELRVGGERLGVRAGELELVREEQLLSLELLVDERPAQALEQDALVRRVLVEQEQTASPSKTR
jgi:hypothetical protein